MGENSPNLVTLLKSKEKKTFEQKRNVADKAIIPFS
jgi:hypothetical protein